MTGALLAVAGATALAQTATLPPSQAETETGIATIYAAEMHGQLTASGEPYDVGRMTAAHRSLPLGTRAKVVNLATRQAIEVTINDRWGGGGGRVINLSERAAREVGFGSAGTIDVRVEIVEMGKGLAYAGPINAQAAQPGRAPLLPERIEPTDNSPSARYRGCQNEASILGLSGDFLSNHVRNCMSRRTGR